ncbi:hypothetical protein RCL_jg16218.t2 [Rhizophagus clarus]|uniref:Uncharacterized protein n=1 Tax=Rhizophagus clarus TaxID=94130 RepID=A0A8H3MEP3_9GLOM|nr:hypothetical protein RCL_jg16218.t2 [Rhizophagus clarus]
MWISKADHVISRCIQLQYKIWMRDFDVTNCFKRQFDCSDIGRMGNRLFSFFGFGGDSLMKMGLSVETELFFLRSAVFLSGSLVETKLNTVTFGRIDNLRMINHQIR